MSLINWLNNNAGAIQGIATVLLVVLTSVYVLLTYTIARAAKEQTDFVEREALGRIRRYRKTLNTAAQRLLNEVKRLPSKPAVTPSVRNHPGWSSSQLGDFIGYVREVPEVDEAAAMEAVSALNRLNEMIVRAKEVNPRHGISYTESEIQSWHSDRAFVCETLETITGVTNAGAA